MEGFTPMPWAAPFVIDAVVIAATVCCADFTAGATVEKVVTGSPNPKTPAVFAILYFHLDFISASRCHGFSPSARFFQ